MSSPISTHQIDPAGLDTPPEPASAASPSLDALLADPHATELGRRADSPAEIGWQGWRAVLRRAGMEMLTDRAALVAAGCAFYGTLALFPAISMLISIYGLLFDPQTVLPQLAVLQDLLPPAAFQLIGERIQMLVSHPPGSLTVRLLFGTAVTLWSAAAATKSLIAARAEPLRMRSGRAVASWCISWWRSRSRCA